jgi:hypothetical protein
MGGGGGNRKLDYTMSAHLFVVPENLLSAAKRKTKTLVLEVEGGYRNTLLPRDCEHTKITFVIETDCHLNQAKGFGIYI